MSFLSLHSQSDVASCELQAERVLGGFRLGGAAPAVEWPEQGLDAVLPGAPLHATVREFWATPQHCISGIDEGVAWRRAGDVLYGVIELDEADFADGACPPLQSAAESAYRRIFHVLEAQGGLQLWRVWNYMAEINAETHGLERYRQFNIGRQEAFEAVCSAVDQAPAACALGVRSGPLSIAFLAGKVPIRPIENPRQLSAYCYPETYGPRSPVFARGALVYPPGQEVLFISGTASIVGHRTVHHDDVVAQVRESLANVRAVMDEANRHVRGGAFECAMLVCRIYLRHAGDRLQVEAVMSEQFAGAHCQYVEADVCRSDLLVEIEAMASQPR